MHPILSKTLISWETIIRKTDFEEKLPNSYLKKRNNQHLAHQTVKRILCYLNCLAEVVNCFCFIFLNF